MKKPVFLVLGAGAGIGGNVAKKFAKEGYHAVLARRSDEDGLKKLVDDIKKMVALRRGAWSMPLKMARLKI